jgi:cytochrome P450
LPPDHAEWLAQQPESLIAASKVQDEVLGLEWLASGPSNAFVHDFTVIRRDLTRQINACVPEILDEIRYAFDKHFCNGHDAGDGWKEVMVNDAVRRAVCSVANRIIVGLPVCRSEEYFHAVSKWWMCFGLTGLIFRSFIPGPLQRFIMPILSLPTLYWRKKVVDVFEPEVARRVRLIQHAKAKSEALSTNDNERSNDLMQWLVEQSSRSTNPAEMSPRNLANKLVLFNLFATHTLTTTFTTLITTLLTHHSSIETLSALRTEASQILPRASETPTLVKNMHLHDSVIRETLRFHPAFDDSMLREVIAPAGLYTPDGTYLPRGSHVALHTRLMQRSSFAGEGEDWDSFRPFRYAEEVAEASEKSTETTVADKGQISAVQISGRYMSFGMGKHAW